MTIDELRLIVLKRDNYRCVNCGSLGPKLYIHHKKYPAESLDDLETLCLNCHPKKKKMTPIIDTSTGKEPQKYRRVNLSVNPQSWADFTTVVIEKHGKLHGGLSTEINLAIDLYLKKHIRELIHAQTPSKPQEEAPR